MAPDELISTLASALRDVIQETPDEALAGDPEQIYADMAGRLIVRLTPDAAIVPRASVKVLLPLPAGYRQMRVVAGDLVRVLALYRREGYELDSLVLAVVDSLVKLRRAEEPRATTASILRELATEILEMAQSEEADTEKGMH